ncbi:MAG TPA: adenine nucleotide alpha hydrolase [Planctomycetes bacterium]|nr:adenine nucleotide alpha hydrolase [Planctomycetota bacterium]
MAREPILLSWSTGKDSAWALHLLREDPRFEVRGLLTTVNQEFGRVAMHGVRQCLLQAQAEALGLPLETVSLPHPCSNAIYEARMREVLLRVREQGIHGVAFGDLFLEDVRRYRERQLEALGLQTHFPLWGMDTAALAQEMVEAGLRAILSCVDPRVFPAQGIGRTFDPSFLVTLPEGVDPCGENGEFHTFAFAGPGFGSEIPIQPGEVVEREGFVFLDLDLPV